MHSHRAFTIFRSLKNREYTGQKLINTQAKIELDKKATHLIADIQIADAAEAYLKCLDEIKTLALLGIKTAIIFFQDHQETKIYDSFNINVAYSLACYEIGQLTSNPQILTKAAYRFTCFNEYCPDLQLPRISEGFNSLRSAATMQGEYATDASYLLAHVYAQEYQYVLSDGRFIGKYSLSDLYHNLLQSLRSLSSSSKEELKKLHRIDYYIIEKDIVITLANLGCRLAIIQFIDWLTEGNDRLSIERDTIKAQYWKTRLNELSVFLKGKYNEYFNIALLNTKQFCFNDLTDCSRYLYKFRELVYSWSTINDKEFIQCFAEIKQEFIGEAMNGSVACHLWLADLAFNDNTFVEAKKWYQLILEKYNTVYAKTPKEIIRAARRCYEIAKKVGDDNQYALLKKAAALGCCDSLLELGNIKLNNGDFNIAKKYYNDALAHSTSAEIPLQITKKLFSSMLEYNAPEGMGIYNLLINGEAIKRGHINSIKELIHFSESINDNELVTLWQEIRKRKNLNFLIKTDIMADEIDKLIDKTIDRYSRLVKEEQERQTASLSFVS